MVIILRWGARNDGIPMVNAPSAADTSGLSAIRLATGAIAAFGAL
jgi:hypothetical protein